MNRAPPGEPMTLRRPPDRPTARALVLLLAGLGACDPSPDKPAGGGDGGGGGGSDGADTADTGSPELVPLSWDALPADLWGLANLDDDDGDGEVDVGRAPGDPDHEPLGLPADLFAARVPGEDLRVTVSGPGVAVWAGDERIADEDAPTGLVPDGAPADSLRVELTDFNVHGALLIEQVSPDGDVVSSGSVAVHSAPLILNHHLQPTDLAIANEVNLSAWGDNIEMMDAFDDVFGDAFIRADGRDYNWDVWVQDEQEFATSSLPGRQLVVTIDSIRVNNDRGLDKMPEDWFLRAGEAVGTWGGGRATSQDSFGNLETSPPVTVGDVHYPYGRVYYGLGATGITQVADELQQMLEAQRVQAPFTLDIDWLCVGHVDEFHTVIPDETAPRGFRYYIADTGLAYALLEGLDPASPLPRYGRDHGYATVGDLLADSSLRAWNEDTQADDIEPNVETFRAELGLTDDEIVRVPALFQPERACNRLALSLIPGTVNMAVGTRADGAPTDLLIADPFLRDSGAGQDEDPLIAAVEALLPASVTPRWVDDWDVYHLAWGEVHCGSNLRRTQTGSWWEDAAHLMEVTP